MNTEKKKDDESFDEEAEKFINDIEKARQEWKEEWDKKNKKDKPND